ncbi:MULTISPECIES: DUF456 family protein [Bacillaceae]|uniref:DUF456 domain-containing protein n=1 Tax=Bacillaceae TaxID=186817 RepID=UPI001E2E77E5|nr:MULTISPECIES: DUF456 family protein [Bacillaceae]MCE4048840.1 DUF456 family protein [Bacillus sp. Au-Bac7]MCM3033099.1 DUF456 family protein [Niallia sp. MER 6]UPO90653.1 DUF456 family protein [Niallia sp. Man26]
MEFVWWAITIILFILSFVGIVYPIIPSVVAIWGGFLVYQFLINPSELSIWFWISMGLLSAVLIAADIIANSYFVKKYGGSKISETIAAIATIVGSFILPPFGIILVPFVAVLITEYILHKDMKKAAKVGFATVIGFLGGSVAKILIQVIMIIWFFTAVVV